MPRVESASFKSPRRVADCTTRESRACVVHRSGARGSADRRAGADTLARRIHATAARSAARHHRRIRGIPDRTLPRRYRFRYRRTRRLARLCAGRRMDRAYSRPGGRLRRSIYLHTDDGRLLQFGHLDAYTDVLANYVAAVQESSGQYEQDLWPEAKRFRFNAGDRIAWTGESGAGGPHMHFEIRRGDIAYQPMRAGLVANDSTKPTLASLTLEPLDGESRDEGSVRPRTFSFGSSGVDTIRAVGRLRAIVAARDGVWRGVDRMIPWSTRMEWNGEWVDARFDSISWATDMVESDYVFDAGRVIGEKGIVLWAPAGWRPRVLVTNVPRERDAGTITIAPGDPPRPLKLVTRDAAGNRVERTALVVSMRVPTGAPGPTKPATKKAPSNASLFELASLPHDWVRVAY